MGQPGDSFTYTCQATINNDTTNTATVTAKTPAGPDVTAHDSADVDVIGQSIAIDKSVDKPTVVAGTLVTYTIKVSNTGDATLTHVTVSDNTFPGCSKADGDIPVLAPIGLPGDSFTYTCTATINADTPTSRARRARRRWGRTSTLWTRLRLT